MWSKGLQPKSSFDNGGPSPALILSMSEIQKTLPTLASTSPKKRALVPGAGRAYDAYYLASLGYESFAVDLSPTACIEARKWLVTQPSVSGTVTVLEGDFFSLDLGSPFDLIWDCTFLCALDIPARGIWARRTSELLDSSGVLLSLVFPITDSKPETEGPPYPLTVSLVEGLLLNEGLMSVGIREYTKGTHMPRMPHFGNAVVTFKKSK
ncbi:hypothetical protein TrST_g3336 [Triparma strigata]|uniref:S-adenosyl-L-methionine-dependent methyltransferase n=1 Tax=Triparma strigata TaxID=1606541 RepID=A0A9W7AK23_9STRA|nr:hypothetical protein TrST_g3336 [Triparma strigata]